MKLFESMAKKMKDKEKKTLPKIVVLFAAGVVLLLIGSLFAERDGSLGGIFGTGGDNVPPPNYTGAPPRQISANVNLNEHVRQLEERLEEILSLVDGAGNVRVMLTVSRGREIVVAKTFNTDSSVSAEVDSAGGTRDLETLREQDAYVLVRQPDGSEIPLVLSELEPSIEGVAIVAEGGSCIVVRSNLIRLTAAALGIGIHKVHLAPAAH